MRWSVGAVLLAMFGCGSGHESLGVDNTLVQPNVMSDNGRGRVDPPMFVPSAPPETPPIIDVYLVCGPQASCPSGSYCDYPATAHCGEHDENGSCAFPARNCDMHSAPVCGCNGVTYLNPCQASAAGTSIRLAGFGCDTVDTVGEDAGIR
jgi:Kazal-type serine protease inhibitor domain